MCGWEGESGVVELGQAPFFKAKEKSQNEVHDDLQRISLFSNSQSSFECTSRRPLCPCWLMENSSRPATKLARGRRNGQVARFGPEDSRAEALSVSGCLINDVLYVLDATAPLRCSQRRRRSILRLLRGHLHACRLKPDLESIPKILALAACAVDPLTEHLVHHLLSSLLCFLVTRLFASNPSV